MDYRTEAHTFTASANFMPLPKLGINVNASYTLGRGNIIDFTFGHFVTDDLKLGYDTTFINPNMPQLYDTYYLNGMGDYSNLDFTDLEVVAGVTYKVTRMLGVGVNYYYTDFQDSESYVYGDQDVQAQSLMAYLTYRF